MAEIRIQVDDTTYAELQREAAERDIDTEQYASRVLRTELMVAASEAADVVEAVVAGRLDVRQIAATLQSWAQ